MDKVKLLDWINERMNVLDKSIKRLQENNVDDETLIAEYSVYQKVMHNVEDGKFD